VFRKFLDGLAPESFGKFDKQHKAIVLPALGAYGTLFLIHNESIELAPPGPNADSEEILSQLDGAVRCDNSDWHQRVTDELALSDLAVFHWATPPTRNMIWELEQALKVLPPSRLLFVESEGSWNLTQFLAERFPAGETPHIIAIDDQYVSYGRPFHELIRKLVSPQPIGGK
jgi:hypothetical protein